MRPLPLACLLTAACVGDIHRPAPSSETPTTLDPQHPTACVPKPISHLVIHRLNRTEYNHAVRDLLGDTTRPADTFAPEVSSYGFDNDSSALTFNSGLLEKLETAAEQLAATAVQNGLITCAPSVACAKSVLGPLARRAWRRPVSAAELDVLAGFVDVAASEGDGFDVGIALGVRAILVSPHFLYRFEVPPEGAPVDQPFALDALALASRLSFFLWSTLPDEELLSVAETGQLLEPATLTAQVQRMLADPKSDSIGAELTRGWLYGWRTTEARLDPTQFPDFDPALRDDFVTESAQFLGSFFKRDQNLLDVLDAPYSYVNGRLARHYGISGITGPDFQRVDLTSVPQRGGLFGLGNFAMGITSGRSETVELRGAWTLRNLLCRTLNPPPADALAKNPKLGPDASRRDVVEARDQMAECKGCHLSIDPVGLALESYDVNGQWRLTDGTGHALDTHGTMAGLGTFDGPRQLAHAMKSDPGVARCLSTTLFRFALGRREDEGDACTLQHDVDALAAGGRLETQDVIMTLVNSPSFRMQAP